jgi:hypothetical protein
MSAPAAIQGTYADLKLIRGRKVAVVCIEIPLEKAEEFVAGFGMPDPAAEKWVAVARLVPEGERQAPPKQAKRLADLPAAQQAALTCQREAFWRFLRESRGARTVNSEEEAAAFVRDFCQVNSRSQLGINAKAQTRWHLLLSSFDDWMRSAA